MCIRDRYTLQCYTVFGKKDEDAREYLFLRQNLLMFAMHFVAFTVLYLQQTELTLLLFYGAQALYLAAVLILFRNLYPLASRLLINNMCMLICTGFIMITRLDYEMCIRDRYRRRHWNICIREMCWRVMILLSV